MPMNTDESIDINQYLEVKSSFEDFLKNDPNNTELLRVLGLIESKEQNFSRAISLIKKAIDISPCAELYSDLGKIYIDNEDFYSAIESCKESIKLDFNNYDAWFYLAFSLKANGQIDDALIAYQKALELKPGACSVYHNLGQIYDNIKNDPAKAIECYKKFLEYQPENEEAKGCIGVLNLKLKIYKEGWEFFEYDRNRRRTPLNKLPILNSIIQANPHWEGEDITDKTIYVYHNDGQGDTIMFARFISLLKNKCAKVLFRPHDSLSQLFKDNDLGVEILDENSDKSELKFDFCIPVMSLPYRLKMNSEKDIPLANGYIKANPQKVKNYHEKYFKTNKNVFKIGIKWQGDTSRESTRKIMLKSFYKLFDLPNTKFYSIQTEGGIEQLAEATEYDIVDLGSTFKDFSDTAAAVENLDLVISNDTSMVHLAGALGKECWTLLPFVQDWRWSMDLSYCPWYKSVKLFKQKHLDNWDEVFEDVYETLEKRLK